MKLALAFLGTMIASTSLGQLVQVGPIGPIDPNYCAKAEHVVPNLVLTSRTHLFGMIVDQSGAPFTLPRITVCRYMSARDQASLKIITTDENGKFELGSLEAGKYRLLLSPIRVFKQPDQLHCRSAECNLEVILRASGTDQPTFDCPIE